MKQECGAGILELRIEDSGRLWLKAPPASANAFPRERLGDLERALGAPLGEAPMIVDVGPVWVVADLQSARTVDRLVPDFAAIGRLTDKLGATGVTVFGADSAEAGMHVRSFAPAHGIPEDPVCGSGNVSVAAFLARSGRLARSGGTYHARQGMQLGRDGLVSIRVAADDIFLGGHSVTCVEGTLRVD
jgi:PhzF family phenazine biosynthesis protein